MYNSKKELRRELKLKRTAISPQRRLSLDIEIQSRLLMTEEYRKCDTVLTYVSTQDEIKTTDIITAAFANKKRVAVPYTNNDHTLTFYYISSLDQLSIGRFNILEPSADCDIADDFSNSICITPALCCDLSGNRLGYGKGCYDRFFKDYVGTKICLCYAENVLPQIPCDEHDIPVDVIVSDSFVKTITD